MRLTHPLRRPARRAIATAVAAALAAVCAPAPADGVPVATIPDGGASPIPYLPVGSEVLAVALGLDKSDSVSIQPGGAGPVIALAAPVPPAGQFSFDASPGGTIELTQDPGALLVPPADIEGPATPLVVLQAGGLAPVDLRAFTPPPRGPAVENAYRGDADAAKLSSALLGLQQLRTFEASLPPSPGVGGGSVFIKQADPGFPPGPGSTIFDPALTSLAYPSPSTYALPDLRAAADADLGAPGAGLTLDGRRLLALASFDSARELTIGASGAAIHTNGHDLTFSGRFLAQGSLNKEGAGTLWLTGANTWNGHGISVQQGALKGASASLQTSIENWGAVEFAQGEDGSYAFQISGPGAVYKSGAGTLTIGHPQAYSGETRVLAGRLAFAGSGRLGALPEGEVGWPGRLVVEEGAAADFSRAQSPSAVGGLAGDGEVDVGAAGPGLVLKLYSEQRFGGSISGGGGPLRQQGGGRQVLTGVSSFSGPVLIESGSLAFEGAGRLGASAAIGLLGEGSAFYIHSADGSREIGSLAGSGFVLLGGNTLITGGDNAYTDFSGAIGGSGGLTKRGSGRMNLLSENFYTGDTKVEAGVLALAGRGRLSPSSGLALAGGSFDLRAADGERELGSLSGTGGEVLLGEHSLSVGGSGGDTLFGGTISGAGRLVKLGTGTLTLSGANSHTGGTSVSAGVLALAGAGTLNPSASLSIVDASFDISGADGARELGSLSGFGARVLLGANTLIVGAGNGNDYFSSRISGSGGLTKRGSGRLELDGANEYTGLTTIEAGTLAVTRASSIPGDVLNQATLLFDTADTSTPLSAYSGSVSGGGRLVKQGAQWLWLRGANRYTGGTLISGGGLIGNAESLQGNIALAEGTGAAFYQIGAGTYSGAVSGDGTLYKYGPGLLTLSGQNTHAGGTFFSGPLRVADDRALGASGAYLGLASGELHAGASFTISRPVAIDAGGGIIDTGGHRLGVSGSVTGSGVLIKEGAGTLVLERAEHSGGTAVTGGRLEVNGALAGNLYVGAGAEFAGPGAVAGSLNSAGRLLRGGAEPGVLAIGGNLGLAPGSALLIRADETGRADRVQVEGSATLLGGSVEVQAQPGRYGTRTDAVILSAVGGVSGRFDAVTTDLAFLAPSLSYEATQVRLRLIRNDAAFDSVAQTPVQQQLARVLGGFLSAQGDARQVADALTGLSAGQARAAFDSIAPVDATQTGLIAGLNQRALGQATRGRLALVSGTSTLAAGLAPEGLQWLRAQPARLTGLGAQPGGYASATGARHGAWVRGYGGSANLDGDGAASDAHYRLGGLALGYDVQLDGGQTVGVMAGYAEPRLNQGPDSTEVAATTVGAYGRWASGAFHADAVLTLGVNRFEGRRQVTVGGVQRTAESRFDGDSLALDLEAGYNVPAGAVALQPLVTLQWARQRRDAYFERGAGALGWVMQESRSWSMRAGAGVRARGGDEGHSWETRALWFHEFRGSAGVTGRLAGDSGGGLLTLEGVGLPRNSAQLGIGYARQISSAWRVQTDLDAEFNSRQRGFVAGLSARYQW